MNPITKAYRWVWVKAERLAFYLREATWLPTIKEEPAHYDETTTDEYYHCPTCGDYMQSQGRMLECDNEECGYRIRKVHAMHAETLRNYLEGRDTP